MELRDGRCARAVKKSARQNLRPWTSYFGAGHQGTKLRLDDGGKGADLPDSSSRGFIMSRECSITGAKPAKGHVIHRRGMAKKKGGVGQHVTANTSRLFTPNLKTKRIWVPELSRFVTVKLSARALKTISKNGAFKTLKKAGLV
jgi:large subunit ribosomal protein L28